MTTIAYRDGVMVADTRTTNDGEYYDKVRKIAKIGPYLVGNAGLHAATLPILRWLEQTRGHFDSPADFYMSDTSLRIPEGSDAWSILVDQRDRLIWHIDWRGGAHPICFEREFESIGSGEAYAIGAMEGGATAAAAVSIAARRDIGTGPKQTQLTFESADTDLDKWLTPL